MSEKFTDRARTVMSLARQEAQRLSSEFVGTEHMLLGLIQEGAGVAAKVLQAFKVDPKRVRAEIERLITPSTSPVVTLGQLPFSPRAKRAMELADEERARAGSAYTSTGQLLIGLLKEQEGIAAQVLQACGFDLDRMREAVFKIEATQQPPERGPEEEKAAKIDPDSFPATVSIRLLERVEDPGPDVGGRVFMVDGKVHVERGTITLRGVDRRKARELAGTIAERHGTSAYILEID